jgi:fructoselysine transporter
LQKAKNSFHYSRQCRQNKTTNKNYLSLTRKINLLQASAINMIDMVGIGPFVVMPLVVSYFHNGLFLWAWIFGAFTAFIDAMIWSELGAAYPLAGGSYNFLRIGYGEKWGKLMSFLFVWQTCIQAPLVVASGAIGFAQYLSYLVGGDGLGWMEQKLVSAALVIIVFLLLYRKTETIGKISVALWIVVILTVVWIIVSGLSHSQHQIQLLPSGKQSFFQYAFWAAIGQGSVKTVYSYLGYYNVCHLGGEIKRPGKNIPGSMFISIAGITVLYLLMNISVMSVIPWTEVKPDEKHLVSIFMEHIYGQAGGTIVTVLILWIALASLFAVVLGYSRVPYAAAADGNFFKIFSRLHPTKNFPYISLIFLCSLGLIFSLLLKLGQVIDSILAMRILVQFIGQTVGLVLLRKRMGSKDLPFKMWLYPVPVFLSICIWLFVFISTGWFALWGSLIAAGGVIVFYISQNWKGR